MSNKSTSTSPAPAITLVSSLPDARLTLPRVLLKPATILRQEGPVYGCGKLIHLGIDHLTDQWFGARTTGRSSIQDYVTQRQVARPEDYSDYGPIHYIALWQILRRIQVSVEDGVFVDFGAGLGRALLGAARLPFRRVVGVEFDPELANATQENLERARKMGRFVCPDVEILRMDARNYEIPDNATVLHFFNPFSGQLLETVAENIADSLRKAPRAVDLFYANPWDFYRVVSETNVIPSHWVRNESVVPWPLYRRNNDGDHYCVYRLDSRPQS